jgi:hypothetical protein
MGLGYAYKSPHLFACTRHTFSNKCFEYVKIISILLNNYVPSIHSYVYGNNDEVCPSYLKKDF